MVVLAGSSDGSDVALALGLTVAVFNRAAYGNNSPRAFRMVLASGSGRGQQRCLPAQMPNPSDQTVLRLTLNAAIAGLVPHRVHNFDLSHHSHLFGTIQSAHQRTFGPNLALSSDAAASIAINRDLEGRITSMEFLGGRGVNTLWVDADSIRQIVRDSGPSTSAFQIDLSSCAAEREEKYETPASMHITLGRRGGSTSHLSASQ